MANINIDYFIAGPEKEVDVKGNAQIPESIHKKFHEVFAGIVSFKGTFSLQIKRCETIPGPTKACGIHTARALQKALE